MSRASQILWENADIIDNMMQQMDDFANANGGYINRSGVGNFRTQAKKEVAEGVGKKLAGAAALAGAVGAGIAAHKTGVADQVGQAAKGAWQGAKPHLQQAGSTIKKAGQHVVNTAQEKAGHFPQGSPRGSAM